MSKGLPNSKKLIKEKQSPLKFNDDGKFKILHICDIHEVDPEMDDDENKLVPITRTAETMNVIEKALEKTNPDLVVFGGDNISGFWQEFTYDYMKKTINRIVEPIKKRNIPLAIVFGNHDAECEYMLPFLNKENQISVYCEYENFRSTFNDEDVFGCANNSLPILSSDGTRVAWNIWCVDSNDYMRDENYNEIEGAGYGYVHQDQIEWYEKASARLKSENGGKPVPSILFQHIPVFEEFELFDEVPNGTPGALGSDGKYYLPKKGAFTEGVAREAPSPAQKNYGQFESWKKCGDIVAAFFGHDHVNTFSGVVDGIKLYQTVGAGYHIYGKERGARLITLDESVTDTLESETLFIDRATDGPLGF